MLEHLSIHEEFVCLIPFLEKDDALNLAKRIIIIILL
jgi:hypothetical protein